MGRIEIFHEGEWGSVCNQEWSSQSSKIACQELGFPGSVRLTKSLRGLGIIWVDRVQCKGSEKSLLDCSRSIWLPNHCTHWDDVTLQCQSGMIVSRQPRSSGFIIN